MKIGILTFHYAVNYGAVLQCMALQNTLLEMGHNVSVIDFKITQRRSWLRRKIDRLLSGDGFSFLTRKKSYVRNSNLPISGTELSRINKSFENFRKKELLLTDSVSESTIGNIANEFDAIVVGSDQVWCDVHEKTSVYLCDWKPQFRGLRISYAACSTVDKILTPHKYRIKKLLSKFQLISVRDKYTADLFSTPFNLPCSIVADPTLLFSFPKCDINHLVEGNYMLVYILRKEIDGGNENAINKLKEIYGNLKVVAIVFPNSSLTDATFVDQFIVANPLEWVSLIANANLVFTDSFHGALFSLKYQRPFVAFYDESGLGKIRFKEIQSRYHIGNNIVATVDDIACIKENRLQKKYPEIINKINEHVELSKTTLKESLNNHVCS